MYLILGTDTSRAPNGAPFSLVPLNPERMDPDITLYRLEKALRLGRELGYTLHDWAPWGSQDSSETVSRDVRRTRVGPAA